MSSAPGSRRASRVTTGSINFHNPARRASSLSSPLSEGLSPNRPAGGRVGGRPDSGGGGSSKPGSASKDGRNRRRRSSVSVMGMSKVDGIVGYGDHQGCSSTSVVKGGVGYGQTAIQGTNNNQGKQEEKQQQQPKFKHVDIHTLRSSIEYQFLKKGANSPPSKNPTPPSNPNVAGALRSGLHRKMSVDEESSASTEDDTEEEDEKRKADMRKIDNVVRQSLSAHAFGAMNLADILDSPSEPKEKKELAVTAEEGEERKDEKPKSDEMKKRRLVPSGSSTKGTSHSLPSSPGKVNVRNLRADTVENTKLKDIMRALEERERAKVVVGEVKGGVRGREAKEDDEVSLSGRRPNSRDSRPNSRGDRPNSRGDRPNSQGSRRSPPRKNPPSSDPSSNPPTPSSSGSRVGMLFVYGHTLSTSLLSAESTFLPRLEFELIPRRDAGRKVSKVLEPQSVRRKDGGRGEWGLWSVIKLDVMKGQTGFGDDFKGAKADYQQAYLQCRVKGDGEKIAIGSVKLASICNPDKKGRSTLKVYRKDGTIWGEVGITTFFVGTIGTGDKGGGGKVVKGMLKEAELKGGEWLSRYGPIQVKPKEEEFGWGEEKVEEKDTKVKELPPVVKKVEKEKTNSRDMRELVAMETLNTTAMILKMTVEKLHESGGQQRQQQVQYSPSQQVQKDASPSRHSPRSRQGSVDILSWGVPDVASWLGSKQLGMSGYVGMFIDQAVDGLALIGMKRGDLDDLGVFNEQHKKKLLLHIAKFRSMHKEEIQGIEEEMQKIGARERTNSEGRAGSLGDNWKEEFGQENTSPNSRGSEGKGKPKRKEKGGGGGGGFFF